ncbi:NAD-dependent succinate-semialdehyde dehydrogenase [Paraburkholderia pallida]|uniref:NAD-dependent succinate-semialdehyde dehydrogenase n=1 Tax=Paraburkholderia pallida TaxID=2547399 RepID=A0A4P7CSD5_9BURK|nr:NAD-dependent succinate-semialdehyde dehydrogenase [Paraburkholderia pallida]QBQ98868.1 NAD-dependent succinate-semialdehyde dehydrogenase [Paraburkholderia pallida]
METCTYPQPRQHIAGQWRDGTGALACTVVNPANETTLASFQAASDDDIAQAVAASAAAFPAWAARSAFERGQIMRAAAQRLRESAQESAMRLTLEQGKPLAEATREIAQAADVIDWFAEEGRRAYGRVIPARAPNVQQWVVQKPVGPVAALTPWNFPVMLSACKLAAALAAGCTVVLKPAEETPVAVMALVDAFVASGTPPGVVQMLIGDPGHISSSLIASVAVRKVSFTGSINVGRLLGEQAGRHLTRVTLELGGHAPVIVCEDADLESALDTLAGFKFRNAGQICANPSRFYVHQSLYQRFVEGFAARARAVKIGDGLAPDTQMGPLASRRRVEQMAALVDDARGVGARIVCGGECVPRAGFFFQPTVLADVPDMARVMNEEPFGPVVPIASFDSLDDVIERANRLPVGLAAYAFTTSIRNADRLADALEAGAVGINSVAVLQAETPFGGVKDSGFGKENGIEGLQDYLCAKFVSRSFA